MKKFFLLLLLVGITAGQAQVIQLDEARVDARAVKISSNGDEIKYLVTEEYSGQFQKNPIRFMKENFDIHQFIGQLEGNNYDNYLVEFRNRKGALKAKFDSKGTLVSTAQRFRNVPLPLQVSRQLLTDHSGWSMVRNSYVATGNGDALDKEQYKITLKNGNRTQNIKIVPDRSASGLVSN